MADRLTDAPRVIHGDCIEAMAAMAECSVDAIVCDPPYHLSFMGRSWDHAPTGAESQAMHGEWAREALRVLKPGGHLLAFGGTRTYHRLACAVEDAGFEIRDSLLWIYGSGFPKSLDVSKAIDKAAGAEPIDLGASPNWRESKRDREKDGGMEVRGENAGRLTAPATPDAERWEGWGTALKPAHEPIVVARKPLAGTVAGNVLAWGCGALNGDGCRIGTDATRRTRTEDDFGLVNDDGWQPTPGVNGSESGRWPANVVLSHAEGCACVDGSEPVDECVEGCPVAEMDRQSGELVSGANPTRRGTDQARGTYGDFAGQGECDPARGVDRGGASRFFYVAKASRGERNAGLADFDERKPAGDKHADGRTWDIPGSHSTARANHHPTVKPIELMRWLVRLVTPPGGTVLDPFTGSGTTGCAAVIEGFEFVGVEREAEYVEIARARIAWWAEHPEGLALADAIAGDRARGKVAETGQTSLMDLLDA